MLFRFLILGFLGLLILPGFAPDVLQTDPTPVSSIERNSSDEAPSPDGVLPAKLAQEAASYCIENPSTCTQSDGLVDAVLQRAERGLRTGYALIIQHRDQMNEQAE